MADPPIWRYFYSLTKLIAVPLVLFSIIGGITSLKSIEELGRGGVKTLLLYLFTTVCAISIGLTLVNLIQPGKMPAPDALLQKRIDYELWLSENPAVKRLDNHCYICESKNNKLVAKVFDTRKANADDIYVTEKIALAQKTKKSAPIQPIVDMIPSNICVALASMEMLQIIFYAIFFGIVLLKLPKEKSIQVSSLVDGLNEVFIKMVNILIKGMPVFVFALMAANLVKAAGNDLQKLLEQLVFLLNYAWVVVLGLGLVAFVFYPILILILTGQNNYRYFLKGIADAQLTAFSTSSSLATLPVTMECVNDKLAVPKSISTFVLPIGATVNMDGTSLYQAVEYGDADLFRTWWEDRYSPIYDGVNKITGLTVVVIDITERKKMETALRESEEKFRKMFHSSPIAICISALDDGRILDANYAYWDLTGLSPEITIGNDLVALNIWPNQNERDEFASKLRAKRSHYDPDSKFIDHNGNAKSTLGFYELIEIGGQERILSMFYDMSAQKNTMQALQQSEARIRALLEATPDMLLETRQ